MQAFKSEFRAHGIIKRIVSNLPVDRNTVVLGSVTEMALQDGAMRPFIGDAKVQIWSIAPQDNGNVDVKLHIDWNSDLDIRLDLVIM